uniref:hypothetical protein n=1 Tax=Shewanella sp. TaxID=50422 RepID=UPI004047A975
MNKQDIQHQIRWQATRDTASTNRWLSSCGIDEMTFRKTDALLLKAQQAAHQTLQHLRHTLTATNIQALEAFVAAMRTSTKQRKLTNTCAYRALNICSKANRQLFKRVRQAKH